MQTFLNCISLFIIIIVTYTQLSSLECKIEG